MEEAMRSVRYHFDADFLRFKTVRTSLKFTVKDKLIRNYDFPFGFCIPNSTNSWETIYPMPENSDSDIDEFVSNPYSHKSDSFYFVNDQLIMHNKAEYAFSRS